MPKCHRIALSHFYITLETVRTISEREDVHPKFRMDIFAGNFKFDRTLSESPG